MRRYVWIVLLIVVLAAVGVAMAAYPVGPLPAEHRFTCEPIGVGGIGPAPRTALLAPTPTPPPWCVPVR